jgi:hypothetical protein
MIYAREFEAQWSAPTSGMFDRDLLDAALLPHDFSFAAVSKATNTSLCSPMARPSMPEARLGPSEQSSILFGMNGAGHRLHAGVITSRLASTE